MDLLERGALRDLATSGLLRQQLERLLRTSYTFHSGDGSLPRSCKTILTELRCPSLRMTFGDVMCGGWWWGKSGGGRVVGGGGAGEWGRDTAASRHVRQFRQRP